MAKISLRQLEVFSTAAKLLSFTKTARQMGMSKPAISKQVKTLEKHCKTKLFEQVGRRIFLTAAGKKLLPQVLRVEEEFDKFIDMLKYQGKFVEQEITVSVGHSYARFIFPILHEFTQKHKIEFDISMDKRQAQFKKLEDDKLDCAITGLRSKHPDMINKQFGSIDFVLVAANHNPLSRLREIDTEMFANETMILIKADPEQAELIDEKFEKSNVKFKKTLRIESYAAISEAIKAGLGIGFVPLNLIQEDIKHKALSVLAYDKFNYTRPIYLVAHKKAKTKDPIKLFSSFLNSEAKLYF